MKEKDKTLVTYSFNPMQNDIYVSIGYLSSFIGISVVRLNDILKSIDHKYQGNRKLYPFGETILFLLENSTFKYSKNLTKNGNRIRKLQRISK